MSNLYQNSEIREQSAPLLFSQPRNQNQSIRLSLQVSLTLACIKTLSKTLPSMHGASHVPASRLRGTETRLLAIKKIGDWKKLEILVQNQSF